MFKFWNSSANLTYYFFCWCCEFYSDCKSYLWDIIASKDANLISTIKRYLSFNEKYFKKNNRLSGVLLVDCFPIPDWIFVNSLFLNKLANEKGLEIVSYGLRGREKITNKLYDSFGCSKHLKISLNSSMRRRRLQKFLEIKKAIETKDELFNLHVNGVWVGMDVYESILRSGVPTIAINKFRTWRFIYIALTYYFYFEQAIKDNSVKAVALSHDNYIGMGLVARIAYFHSIPVYLANSYGIMKTLHSHQIYEVFKNYKRIFNSLDDFKKIEGIKWSKTMLTRRINGEVGVEMSYQKKSSYHSKRISNQLIHGEKLKVIVATHCFYDSPHGFGGMLFNDFYEWLTYLGNISMDTDYEWYLKPHADYLPGTIEILEKFASEHPKFRVIDPRVSWHQLKDEGAKIALTCYGSIGHELPLLGWKVVNASYNPHIAYNFNWHARDKDHYKELLKNLASLREIDDVEKIYEFFYVHKKLVSEDNFFFDSAAEFTFSCSNISERLKSYNEFVDIAPKIFSKASYRMENFIKSNCTSTNKYINASYEI
jgi:hypothetical protein